jgi:hypothetical protein
VIDSLLGLSKRKMNNMIGATDRKRSSRVRMVATKQKINPPSNIAERTISAAKYLLNFSCSGMLFSILPTLVLKKKYPAPMQRGTITIAIV